MGSIYGLTLTVCTTISLAALAACANVFAGARFKAILVLCESSGLISPTGPLSARFTHARDMPVAH